ncbi:MAG: hypothetical protein LBS89_07785 [Zoogloeaceae bacterium]|jgi:hypothetical protein|nr:hypothetical protein [Zoogloeaceae bacterium]
MMRGFFCLLLSLCEMDFPITLYPDAIEYISGEQRIALTEKERENLRAFLQKHSLAWQHDFKTYAHAQIFFAEKMHINCMTGGVIVNFLDEDGAWKQISKKIAEACPLPSQP